MTDSLTKRQLQILFAIVQKYIQTAMPVGSKYLTEHYKWNYSPATVRNEMNLLEELDYVFQPYTSAGRVPLEPGYREFVNSTLEELVSQEEEILPQFLEKDDYASWDELFTELTNKLSGLLSNVVVITTIDRKLYYAGLADLLKQPEFSEAPNAIPVLELIEDARNIFAFLKQLEFQPHRKLTVSIGREHMFKSLYNFSSISSYFDNPSMKGWLTVFGPMRMPYRRALRMVNQITHELDNLENY